jgi:hypothetical protein
MGPFQSVQWAASQTVVVTAQSDQNSDNSTTASEACHMCSVVPFLTAAPSMSVALDAPAIPDGATMQLSVFANPLTAPPPRA